MKKLTLASCYFFFASNNYAFEMGSRPHCIVSCGGVILDKEIFKALSSSKPFQKNDVSNLNCFEPKLTCLDSEGDCSEKKLPHVSWFNKVKGGKAELIHLRCSVKNKRIIEGDLPKGLFVGEGQFQIDWSQSSKVEAYFYKAISGE